jgi:hypothetical protein
MGGLLTRMRWEVLLGNKIDGSHIHAVMFRCCLFAFCFFGVFAAFCTRKWEGKHSLGPGTGRHNRLPFLFFLLFAFLPFLSQGLGDEDTHNRFK